MKRQKKVRKLLWENSLTIAMFFLFFIFLVGLSVAGFYEYNQEQKDHGQQTIAYTEYLTTPNFGEAVFENWESEFLQMWAFVVLTIFLRQKSSVDSKKMRGKEEVDTHSKYSVLRSNTWPQAKKALTHALYSHSLNLSLLFLFIMSFVFHAMAGVGEYNQELQAHDSNAISAMQYVQTSRFWFESFQNWQSEFLAVGALILLSVYLRERGSPESKPVGKSYKKTGK